MPVINFDKQHVLKLIGKSISDEKLADRVAFLGTAFNSITKNEIITEVYVVRPDMWCDEGLARALRSFLGIKTGLQSYAAKGSSYSAVADASTKIRPFIGLAVVKGAKVDDSFIRSIIQLQEKLNLSICRKRRKADIGLFDLDKVKFPIKYTTVPRNFKFKPLLAEKEMTVTEILEKTQQGKEYGDIVSKFERLPAFIDANNTLMCVIPVLQSEYSKLTEKTKNILIDVIGLDERTVMQVLNILTCNILERGGELYTVKIEHESLKTKITTPDLSPMKMDLRLNYVNKLLGLKLTPAQIIACLAKMGHAAKAKKDKLEVLTPVYRIDILHPMDLVEEVAIAYGYENFKPELPNISTVGEEMPRTRRNREIAEVCVGLGLQECCTLHLGGESQFVKNMLLGKKGQLVKVINSINMKYDTVRDALLPNLLKVLGESKHYEYPQNLFELGEAAVTDGKNIKENDKLAIVLCHSATSFAEIRSYAEALARALDKKASFKTTEHPSFIKGRAAEVIINGKSAGVLGEIHPKVLNNFEIEQPVAALEIDAEALFS